MKSAKETPCSIDLNKLPSILVRMLINFVVLCLFVYFYISLFNFILTTTGSVFERMRTTLERGVSHILATVCLSGGAERTQQADILTREKNINHSTEDHVEGNRIVQNLLNMHDTIDRQATC